MAYLVKHSTLDSVMVSVVSSNPTGGNFLKFFKPLDVNFSLKRKCDLIVKNSILISFAICLGLVLGQLEYAVNGSVFVFRRMFSVSDLHKEISLLVV